MRGIAAMMVLVGHFINWKFKDNPVNQALSYIFNANDAVSFFFVLSGFVLSWAYFQNNTKPLAINKYYVNRIFRLHPGYIVALFLCLLYYNRHQLNFDRFTTLFLLNKEMFWEEFFMFRGINNIFLPGWTLSVELNMSFLMPFIIIIGRFNKQMLYPLLIASVLASYILGFFFFHFVLGALIAANYDFIIENDFKKSFLYKYRIAILLLSILLFSVRTNDRIFGSYDNIKYILAYLKIDYYVITGIASGIFLLYTLHFKSAQNFFRLGILQFYGRISYGIYLAHWVFVIAFYDKWDLLLTKFNGNKTGLFIFGIFAVLLLTTLTATLLYYFVEKPFMKLGKKIADRMKAAWVI
jgi:peptidoglycan/LPS O-acetylase OafA/YrhL